ncbi:ABC transporter permease [Rhodobacter sp. SGA-6-6]|uniref:ABC transporter permease n=1 Tax=Rhodobacter sp. SGA-6-6 TaxID=2710882 RepID=UPI0013EACEF3|nr:ABC transporter permease [Rhodobacter sp. SGA-6-6]NGM46725.1 ABC transporter permease [Rhodobacter sp. SGA-6-6]
MEDLSWTGALGPFLVPVINMAAIVLAIAVIARILVSLADWARGADAVAVGGPVLAARRRGLGGTLDLAAQVTIGLILLCILLIGLGGFVLPGASKGILGWAALRFWPVWVALVVTLGLSIRFKRRLGLYGKLMDSPVGLVGLALVLFWVFTAIFADAIITQDPLGQLSGMKNIVPGAAVKNPSEGDFAWYLFGGDHLARDVFSRMVMGAQRVLQIAPAATVFAFMVGVTLGLPAGYFGGKLDTLLSFLANLVLAFPVILLFYLLVTPEIVQTGIPMYFAAVLFLFPVIFFAVLFNSRYKTNPPRRNLYVGVTLVLGLWAYLGLAFNADPLGVWSMDPNMLNVFVSVVFVNSPGVFRIVRGLVMDIKARDYVAAGQTRGESPWYIMLWEILPNARGPLIVDFCLRIGYTTILLGTLGFFGLGVSPESPDWGSTINAGRKLLSIFPHPAIVPAVALMSLVLGLNLLADGLREESLKD